MNRLIAVGDIHGCAETLRALLQRVGLERGDTLITIGDLSSKGIDSRGVHQQLVDLDSEGVEVIPLLGNHELMLLAMQRLIGVAVQSEAIPDALFHDAAIAFFIRQNGTWATLKSYGFDHIDDEELWAFAGVDPRAHFQKVSEKVANMPWQLPPEHLNVLSMCKTHHVTRNCVFVHAGMHADFLSIPDARMAVQKQIDTNPRDLCWNRDWLGTEPQFPELLVHGHTPLAYLYSRVPTTDPWKDDDLIFRSVVHAGALNLDSGAFMESGHLTAVEVPEDGDPKGIEFIRVPRMDPVERDRLWYMNHR